MAQESNPGREAQMVGTALFLGEDPDNIYAPVYAVLGNQGDSQCYLGVQQKVEAIEQELSNRTAEGLRARLIPANYVGGVSDGQLNGTDRMRFSLIGRELSHDAACLHLSGSNVEAAIAVVACDKPPVGTLAALLEHNRPSIIMSDGSIKPGRDSISGEPIDIVSCFQVAGETDEAKKERYTLDACPGYGSCGGMFTYNTMQSFIAVLGMEPLHMVSPASEDQRRVTDYPRELVDYLQIMVEQDIRPRDIVTPASLRNAMKIAIVMGGSTNVVLHGPEIARAAGIDLWTEVMSQAEFNDASERLPVLVNARPFGRYSMVDIDAKGGLPVIVKQLLAAGELDGSTLTCTGETLAEQVARLQPPLPDSDVIHSMEKPFKETGGLRLLSGNLAPDGGAIIKVAGVEGGIEDGKFTGRARVFDSEQSLLDALAHHPDVFEDKDMVVIRYVGPRGAPGMPEMLDPTSRITALCRQKNITIALMTDARFSGGSVGLVVGHVSPEASEGGPIALVKDGDTITIDLADNSINCQELADYATDSERYTAWAIERGNGREHPSVQPVDNRLLKRMRAMASDALHGAGIAL